MEKSHLCIWLIRLNTFPSKWLKTITSKSIQMDNHQSFMFINMSWNLFCVYVCVTLWLTAVHMTEWTSACGLGQTDKVSQKLTNAQTSRKSIHSTYLCCPWLVDSDKLKLNLLKFRERSEGHCWHGCHWRIWFTPESACPLFLLWPLFHYFCTSVLYCLPDMDLSPRIQLTSASFVHN